MIKRRIKFQWPIRIIKYDPDRDSRRSFTHTQQVSVWEHQGGRCGNGSLGCGIPLDMRTVIHHHIVPWYKGGKTIIDNCVALCPNCHQRYTFDDNLGAAEENRK